MKAFEYKFDNPQNSEKKVKMVAEFYRDGNELVHKIRSRTCPHVHRYDNSLSIGGENTGGSWSGFDGKEDLESYLAYGTRDLKLINSLDSRMKSLRLNASQKGMRQVYDIVGDQIDVGAALSGDPTCMIRTDPQMVPSRILKVVWAPGVTADIDADDIKECASHILGILMPLEKQGYQLEITAVCAFAPFSPTTRSPVYACGLGVKKAGEALNPRRMLYPLIEPSFFRGAMFSWYTSLPDATVYSSLGTSLKNAFDEYDVPDILNTLFNEGTGVSRTHHNLCVDMDSLIRMTKEKREDYIKGGIKAALHISDAQMGELVLG